MNSIQNFSSFTIRDQSCPNSACQRYGEGGSGNIVVHSQKDKRFLCTACHRSWVAHRATFRYRLRTDHTTVERATEWLAYGLSIRRTAARLRVSPSTVLRWKKKFSSKIPSFKSY